jgi:DNA replication protein DnaC
MTSFVKILETIHFDPDEEYDLFEKLCRADLLILDDLGAERETSYALEKVYSIIDTRNSRSLPIILTTNLSVDEMNSETNMRHARIYDRILGTCYPIQFTGPSWRKKSAYERFEEMKQFLENE